MTKEKEKIKTLLKLSLEFHTHLEFSYIPSKVIYSTADLYSLYYGGWRKIGIGEQVRLPKENGWIDVSENLDKVAVAISDILEDNIGPCILEALKNLEMDDCDLKYFDREPIKLKKFQEEVLRLKKQNKL